MNAEIKLEIDLTDQKQVEALNSFISVLNEGAPKKEATTRSRRTASKTEPTSETEDSGIKIEDVRALLAKKVKEHRVAIKDKLTELKAANVTSLEVKHYELFHKFLSDLED